MLVSATTSQPLIRCISSQSPRQHHSIAIRWSAPPHRSPLISTTASQSASQHRNPQASTAASQCAGQYHSTTTRWSTPQYRNPLVSITTTLQPADQHHDIAIRWSVPQNSALTCFCCCCVVSQCFSFWSRDDTGRLTSPPTSSSQSSQNTSPSPSSQHPTQRHSFSSFFIHTLFLLFSHHNTLLLQPSSQQPAQQHFFSSFFIRHSTLLLLRPSINVIHNRAPNSLQYLHGKLTSVFILSTNFLF